MAIGGDMSKPRDGKGVRAFYYGGKQGRLPRSYWKHVQDENLCIMEHVLPGGAGIQLTAYLRYLDEDPSWRVWSELFTTVDQEDNNKDEEEKK